MESFHQTALCLTWLSKHQIKSEKYVKPSEGNWSHRAVLGGDTEGSSNLGADQCTRVSAYSRNIDYLRRWESGGGTRDRVIIFLPELRPCLIPPPWRGFSLHPAASLGLYVLDLITGMCKKRLNADRHTSCFTILLQMYSLWVSITIDLLKSFFSLLCTF